MAFASSSVSSTKYRPICFFWSSRLCWVRLLALMFFYSIHWEALVLVFCLDRQPWVDITATSFFHAEDFEIFLHAAAMVTLLKESNLVSVMKSFLNFKNLSTLLENLDIIETTTYSENWMFHHNPFFCQWPVLKTFSDLQRFCLLSCIFQDSEVRWVYLSLHGMLV